MVPSIVFTPDDLDLVKGSAGNRRRAVDALGSQVNANYDVILRDYERVLRHKNRLLKDEASDALVDSIDEMLVTCGAQLTCYRHALLDRLMPHMIASYEGISGKKGKAELRVHAFVGGEDPIPIQSSRGSCVYARSGARGSVPCWESAAPMRGAQARAHRPPTPMEFLSCSTTWTRELLAARVSRDPSCVLQDRRGANRGGSP